MSTRGGLRQDLGAPDHKLRVPQLRDPAIGQGVVAGPANAIAEALEHRRLIVLLPFCLLLGLVVYAGLPEEPSLTVWLSLAGLAAVALLFAIAGRQRSARIATLLFATCFGVILLPLHGLIVGTHMQAYPAYGNYSARVDTVLSRTPDSARIVVSNITPHDDARDPGIRRARILVRERTDVMPGDIIRANLRLASVPGPILPGSFDNQFHAYFDGIGAFGNVTSSFTVTAHPTSVEPMRVIESLRQHIGDRVVQVIGGQEGAIARAMTIGDQSLISDETREIMADSGLAHIYSISGLHLSIVAGGVYFLLRALLAMFSCLSARVPIKKIAAIAGLMTATGYLLLAGGPGNIPAFRSTLMLGLIFGAVLAGRQALTMRNVAIAALVIILLAPADIFRASFQLSFAAVVALIGIYELVRPPGAREKGLLWRLATTVWGAAMTSAIAGAATLLFSAYHFQQTAPLGVVGNVLALPYLSGIIMPFGVLGVVAMPVGLDAPMLMIMGWGIEQMLAIAALVTEWSRGLEMNPLLKPVALIIGLAALAWFAFLRDRWRFAGPALAIPLIALFGFDVRPDILIADTTQAFAVQSGAGMGLVSGRTGTFATDVWSEHYETEIAPEVEGTRCDSAACIFASEEYSLSLVEAPDAYAEDCGRHDLIVTRGYAPRYCARRAKLILDAGDFRYRGVHWLKWQPDAGFVVRTAIPEGDRPWRVSR